VLQRDWYCCHLPERAVEKIKYLLRSVTTPNVADWQFLSLPQPLSFLYPVYILPSDPSDFSATNSDSVERSFLATDWLATVNRADL
jgi:hypothetical protein